MPASYWMILFLVSCLLSIFYWELVQPVLLRKVSFSLFRRRDRLRRMAIMSEEDHNGSRYREVEEFICKTISIVPAVSLTTFLYFVYQSAGSRTSEFKRLRDEAPKELRRLIDGTTRDALLIMLLNSPIISFIGIMVVGCLCVLGKINRPKIYRKTEYFIEELPDDLTGSPIATRLAA